MERRAVWGSYGFQLLFGLLLWLPIFYEYQRVSGLSDSDIFAIQSLYYTAFCLLEIPTGLLADRFDYRYTLVAGGAVLVVANLVPVFRDDYTGFLLHFLLVALARSLVSGASSAYLYEYLHRTGNGQRYQSAEGRARAYSLIGKIAIWPAVGLLMSWNRSSPYWLTAVFALGSVLAAVLLPPLPPSATTAGQERPGVLASFRGALRAMGLRPMLLVVMVQGVAVFTLARLVTVNLFQPVLGQKEVPLLWHGAVMAAMTVSEALGAVRPGWFRGAMSNLRAVSVLTGLSAVACAAVVWSSGWGTATLLCVFCLLIGTVYPIQRTLFGEMVPLPRYRATLLSIESIIDRAVCALVALALGATLSGNGLDLFLVACSVGAVLLMILVALVARWLGSRAAAEQPVTREPVRPRG